MQPVVRTRMTLLVVVVATAALAVGARLYDLQIRRATELAGQARRQHEQRIEIEGGRGEILDRNGREFAVSLETRSLYAHPPRVPDPARAARILAPLLRQSSNQILEKLRSDAPFVWIARRLNPSLAAAVNALDLPIGAGQPFDFETEGKRFYPQGHLGVHVVGFADIDQRGVEGIERVFDAALQGEGSSFLAVRDGRGGMFMQPVGDLARKREEDVVLTLDLEVQHVVERELDRAMRETRARAASVVVLDPATGEILALANRPTADPNQYGKAEPDARRNRAVVDLFEPGSTFKAFVGAAALETGVVVPSESFDCENGVYAFAGRRIRDHHSFRVLTFREILEESSNIGMVKVGTRMSHSDLRGYVSRFGFGRKTGIELPGEPAGILAPASRWTPSTRASVSFGHEVGVTPLQLAVAVGAVANEGVLVPPRIVLGTRDVEGRLHPAPTREPRRVLEARTASLVSDLLEGVIERGTGKQAAVPGYRLAGKTGTAQKVIAGKGYSATEFMSSFVGFGPVRSPRVVCLVVLDTPAGSIHTGGLSAAPVFSRIMAESLANLRVPPDEDVLVERKKRLEEERRQRQAELAAKKRTRKPAPAADAEADDAGPIATAAGQIPDVRGLSLRDAVANLVARRVKVSVEGSGFVIDQAPQPGAPIQDGQFCALRLEARPQP